MKVLFVIPPNYRFRRSNMSCITLGPLYLAAAIRKKHDVMIYDVEAISAEEERDFRNNPIDDMDSHYLYVEGLQDKSHYIWKEVEKVISDYNPNVICISTMTCSYPAGLEVARIAKKVNDAITIFGGAHPNALPLEVIQEDVVDYVVKGESELTFPQLIECLDIGADVSDVCNVFYKINGEVVQTDYMGPHKNLDDFSPPARDLILFPERFKSDHFAHIISSRGCPDKCNFCSNNINWGSKVRFRSVDNFMAELREIAKISIYGNFLDDNFQMSKKMAYGVSEKIIEEGIEFHWRCESSVRVVFEDRLKISKEAGLWDVILGLESGSDKTLQYLNKNQTVADAFVAADKIHRSGLAFTGNMMFGFEEEEENDLQMTLDFIREIPAANIAVSKFIPLPGTQLFTILSSPQNPKITR